ncbi:MAG: CopG family transcriptional regulator [Ilumatobacteraceae bacterium]
MKTLAIRLDDDLHARLSVLAQLSGSTITDEIRTAIDKHLETQAHNPELTGKAQAVLDDIERDAQARRAAIATMFGTTEPARNGSTGRSKRANPPSKDE